MPVNEATDWHSIAYDGVFGQIANQVIDCRRDPLSLSSQA
jgi:hypothetical protein